MQVSANSSDVLNIGNQWQSSPLGGGMSNCEQEQDQYGKGIGQNRDLCITSIIFLHLKASYNPHLIDRQEWEFDHGGGVGSQFGPLSIQCEQRPQLTFKITPLTFCGQSHSLAPNCRLTLEYSGTATGLQG